MIAFFDVSKRVEITKIRPEMTASPLELSPDNKKAILRGSWSPEFARELSGHEVESLELNSSKGWQGDNLDFLAAIPHLKYLTVIDLGLASAQGLHALGKLEELTLVTYDKDPIDFRHFPKLKRCNLYWRRGADNLFLCRDMRELFLDAYTGSDLQAFSQLHKLTSLGLVNGKACSLRGLSNLRELRTLRLGGMRKLSSLDDLLYANSLHELTIQQCKKITDLRPVGDLHRLRKLSVLDCGEIASLAPLLVLTELEEFYFYESTNILDGDMAPLFRLPHLKATAFMNRRHYSHKSDAVEAFLASKVFA